MKVLIDFNWQENKFKWEINKDVTDELLFYGQINLTTTKFAAKEIELFIFYTLKSSLA